MLLTKRFLNSGCLQQIKVHDLWGEFWPGNSGLQPSTCGGDLQLYIPDCMCSPYCPALPSQNPSLNCFSLIKLQVVGSRLQFLIGCRASTSSGSAPATPGTQDGWTQVAMHSLTRRSKTPRRSLSGAPPIDVLWKSLYTTLDCFHPTFPGLEVVQDRENSFSGSQIKSCWGRELEREGSLEVRGVESR